jgi:hypothetical protein
MSITTRPAPLLPAVLVQVLPQVEKCTSTKHILLVLVLGFLSMSGMPTFGSTARLGDGPDLSFPLVTAHASISLPVLGLTPREPFLIPSLRGVHARTVALHHASDHHRRRRRRRRCRRRRRRGPTLPSPALAPSILAPRTAFARPTIRRITTTARRAPSRRRCSPLEGPCQRKTTAPHCTSDPSIRSMVTTFSAYLATRRGR